MPPTQAFPGFLLAAICLSLAAGLDAGDREVRARADRLEGRIMELGKIGVQFKIDVTLEALKKSMAQ